MLVCAHRRGSVSTLPPCLSHPLPPCPPPGPPCSFPLSFCPTRPMPDALPCPVALAPPPQHSNPPSPIPHPLSPIPNPRSPHPPPSTLNSEARSRTPGTQRGYQRCGKRSRTSVETASARHSSSSAASAYRLNTPETHANVLFRPSNKPTLVPDPQPSLEHSMSST